VPHRLGDLNLEFLRAFDFLSLVRLRYCAPAIAHQRRLALIDRTLTIIEAVLACKRTFRICLGTQVVVAYGAVRKPVDGKSQTHFN
jgi:hypothetical protein